jgi:hypothetical protein
MILLKHLLLVFLMNQVPNELFPSREMMAQAENHLRTSRTMMSDYPSLYRRRWSLTVGGPCPSVLVGPGMPNDQDVPCSIYGFTPNPNYPLPSVLHMGYRNLIYTPPRNENTTKASLSISWEYTIISAGIIWKLTINAEGIKHDLFFCEYQVFQQEIEIAPFISIDVEMLRPRTYYHVSVKPTGNYSIQTHTIREWETPMSATNLGLIYDVQPNEPVCGTPTYVYTTKPAEELMEVFGSLVADVPDLVSGDRQRIVTPMVGFRDCGEFSFPAFHQFMTHRPAPGPTLFAEGPPIEIWSFQGSRDISESTRQVLEPEAEISNSRVGGIRDQLQAEGLSGPVVEDQDMVHALNEQEALDDQRFKSGRDMAETALALIEMLQENPENDHLWELYENFVGPNIDHIERLNDTSIEFNPFGPTCSREGYLGEIPILGAHCFSDPQDCGFCEYHARIVHQPRNGWSHSRLIDVDWIWSPIHGETGNIREAAHRFIRAVIYPEPSSRAPKDTMTDIQNGLASRQREEVHQGQVSELNLGDLERIPSDTTTNTTESEGSDTIPAIFRDRFDRCTDPSWTIEYMFLFNELQDIFDAPCGLLWGVAG